ncbi:hypothetical protein LLH23_21805 [bacterium]|nr:hypothetical protein [bacterium]
MLGLLLLFVAMGLLVVAAGTLLSYAADAIAAHTGIGRLTIGIIMLAAATTLPEIIVDISAVRLPAPNLAVGDIMGSCTMNILILAAMDLLHHWRRHASIMPSFGLGHARIAILGIVLAAIAGASIIAQEPFSIGGIGLGVLAIAVLYPLDIFVGVRAGGQGSVDVVEVVPGPIKSLRAGLICFGVGAAVIALAGPVLARLAHDLAALTGLGDTFFGSVFLALVTSLPELAASLAALRLGALDLIIGNILGSNAFNMAALLLFDVADRGGPLLAQVEARHALTAFVTIVLTGLVMQIMMVRQLRRTWFIEPAGTVVLMAALFGVLVMYLAP